MITIQLDYKSAVSLLCAQFVWGLLAGLGLHSASKDDCTRYFVATVAIIAMGVSLCAKVFL